MSTNTMLIAGTSVNTSVDTPVFHSFIADGILAAHLRRRARQDQQTVDDIPIVYNLLDYLILALPGGADVLIATDDQETAPFSTAIGGPCSIVDVATIKAHGVRFTETDGLWLAPLNLSDSHQKEVLASVATWVSHLAASRGPDVAMELSRRLSRGLTQLVRHLTAHPFVPSVPASEVVLDDIIEHTLENFDRVLKNADDTYSFVIRYWTAGGPRLIDLKRKTEPPSNSGIARQVRKVLDTGVARWALVKCDTQGPNEQPDQQGKMAIAIPGHFGGVPWLVTCRELPIADRAAEWWAYTAYRDYSVMHTLLRGTAITSVASEMRRMLLSALNANATSNAFTRDVEAEWSRLTRVYPISLPSLRDITPSPNNAHRLLSIAGHHYDVAFSDEANAFFTWPTLPTASDSEGYGPFSAADAQAHFITPVQAELNRIHSERQAAESSAKKSAIQHYGHTMGHRIAPIVAYFARRSTTNEAASCARFVGNISLVLQAYSADSPAEFFALNAEKSDRFVVANSELDLVAMLTNEVAAVASMHIQTKQGMVYRWPQFILDVTSARVAPMLNDSVQDRVCRLNDACFAQLLTELVLNAVRHGWCSIAKPNSRKKAGVPIHVGVAEVGGTPTMVISNYYSAEHKLPPAFFTAQWQKWPIGRPNDGPGMAVDLFRRLEAGDMFLRADIPTRDEPGQLHVALSFRGLKIG